MSTYYYLCCEKCKKLVQFYAVRFPARVAFMKHYDDIPAFVERHISCGTPKVISEHDDEFKYDEEFKHDPENDTQDVDGKCGHCGSQLTEITANDLSTQLVCLFCRDESEATQ